MTANRLQTYPFDFIQQDALFALEAIYRGAGSRRVAA